MPLAPSTLYFACNKAGLDPADAADDRYYGVLAPNSPLRDAVTALTHPTEMASAPTMVEPIQPDAAPAEPAHRQAARYVWALLLARIYEALPLLCPKCGGEMKIIAFITDDCGDPGDFRSSG